MRHPELSEALDKFGSYIGSQTLASKVELVESLPEGVGKEVEIEKGIETVIQIEKDI